MLLLPWLIGTIFEFNISNFGNAIGYREGKWSEIQDTLSVLTKRLEKLKGWTEAKAGVGTEGFRMLDFEQQANQAQALASLDEDWHLLEGERTTFAIFLLVSLSFAFIYIWIVSSMLNVYLVKTCIEIDISSTLERVIWVYIYIAYIYYYWIRRSKINRI